MQSKVNVSTKPKLLDDVRTVCQLRHRSIRTTMTIQALTSVFVFILIGEMPLGATFR